MRSTRSSPLFLSSSYLTFDPSGISITALIPYGRSLPGLMSCHAWAMVPLACSALTDSTKGSYLAAMQREEVLRRCTRRAACRVRTCWLEACGVAGYRSRDCRRTRSQIADHTLDCTAPRISYSQTAHEHYGGNPSAIHLANSSIRDCGQGPSPLGGGGGITGPPIPRMRS